MCLSFETPAQGLILMFEAPLSQLLILICSPSFAPHLLCIVLPELHWSNHFPVLITTCTPKSVIFMLKRWCMDYANWMGFTAAMAPTNVNGNVKTDVHSFSATITLVAVHYIRQTGIILIDHQGVLN